MGKTFPAAPAFYMLTLHLGFSSLLSYLGKQNIMAQGLGPCTHVEDLEEAHGTALAVVAIWAVNQWVEDLSSPAPGMLFQNK